MKQMRYFLHLKLAVGRFKCASACFIHDYNFPLTASLNSQFLRFFWE